MKKAILFLLIIGMGGALYFLETDNEATSGFLNNKNALKSRPSALNAQLPVDTTAGYLGVESPHALVAAADKIFAGLLDDFKAALPPVIMTYVEPKSRATALGFDPATAAGWASIGIDAAGGAFMGADVVLMESQRLPLFFFKATDLKKLTTFVSSKLGFVVTATETAGPSSIIQVINRPEFFVGNRGTYTVLMPVRGRSASALEKQRLRFEAYLGRKGPMVSSRSEFVDATAGPTSIGRLLGFLNTKVIISMLNARRPWIEGVDQVYYADRFPAAGFVTGPGTLTARVVASPAGQSTLESLFKAPGKPNLVQFVPKTGWTAARVSINLKDLFMGIAEMIPPSQEKARMMLPMAQIAFAAKMGFPYDNLAKALTGHMLIAFDTSAYAGVVKTPKKLIGMPAFIAFGVKDRSSADQTILSIANLVSTMAGGPGASTQINIGDSTGFQWSLGSESVTLIRHEDTLFVSTSLETIKKAMSLKAKDSLASTQFGRTLEAPGHIYSVYVNAGDWARTTINALRTSFMATQMAEVNGPLEKLLTQQEGSLAMMGSLSLDKGIRLTMDGGGALVAMAGLAAAVVIPSVIKFSGGQKSR
jgi:hypothetical protein